MFWMKSEVIEMGKFVLSEEFAVFIDVKSS
jgi:hypothetical protein